LLEGIILKNFKNKSDEPKLISRLSFESDDVEDKSNEGIVIDASIYEGELYQFIKLIITEVIPMEFEST